MEGIGGGETEGVGVGVTDLVGVGVDVGVLVGEVDGDGVIVTVWYM